MLQVLDIKTIINTEISFTGNILARHPILTIKIVIEIRLGRIFDSAVRPGVIIDHIVAPSVVLTIATIVLLAVTDVHLVTIDVHIAVIDDRPVDPNLEILGQILANLVHLVDTVAVKIDIFLGLPVDTILAL